MSIRLRQIALVANKLAPVIDDLKGVFGLEVCYIDPGVKVFGLENSLLPVGNNFIEVVASIKDGTAGGRYLKRRGGDGGYMVICQCESHAVQLERRERATAMGIRTAWERESDGYHVMQLHPADTGGSFFEIDWDAKASPRATGSRRAEADGGKRNEQKSSARTPRSSCNRPIPRAWQRDGVKSRACRFARTRVDASRCRWTTQASASSRRPTGAAKACRASTWSSRIARS